MMRTTQHPSQGRKKGGKRRALVWFALLVALVMGLGFFVTRGDFDFSETLSTVREISEDATKDLKSTVDSAVRTDSERQKLAARIAELENRVARLEEESSVAPIERSDKQTRLGRRIEFELFTTGAFDMQAIDVAVVDGQVTLSGAVRAEAERVLAERIAEEVAGVTQVVNELRIEPAKVHQTGG